MITYIFRKMSQASPLKESLAYILVLRALFLLLLQMVRCTMVTTSTVYTQRWVTTRIKGVVIPYVLSTAFVGLAHYLALYLN
jgi:hypothetical protein